MSVYKCSFRIYIIFYHRRPFNKTAATLVRPHPISTLCTTPLGKMWVCRKVVKYLVEEAGLNGARQGGEQGVEEQDPQELRPGAGATANHRPVEEECKTE